MSAKNISACALLAALSIVLVSPAQAQTAYGVNAAGSLFSFDVNSPSTVTTIGNVGFVPEGIDFLPSSRTLYAIDIGPVNSQLYTLNTSTGAATAVGAGFASVGNVAGTPYNLATSTGFGFDFNPKTLQADLSMRIRLVGTSGVDLRLNSSTGAVAAVDVNLAYAAGDANAGATPDVTSVAYINNIAGTAASGTTALFDLDDRAGVLASQNPPNNGTLNTIGPFGATIVVQPGGGFDIFTDPLSTDASIGGDRGLAVLQRTGVSGGAYLLYDVSLATGGITNGRLVGGGAGADFTGGFAVVPEPSSLVLGLVGLVALVGLRRRARRV